VSPEPTERFELAVVQMDVRLGDLSHNVARIEGFIRESVGARLCVFPECAITGYTFESLDEARRYAETIPGPSTAKVAQVCGERGVHVVVGLVERDEDRVYNSLALIGPGGVIGVYRKTHLPHLGVDHFASRGDHADRVYDLGFVRLGMNICYDGAFPETARLLALRGADLIVLPTNWPNGAEEFARYGINTRALENVVYYASCDRVGDERGFRFIGLSRISDPHGRTLAEADGFSETILQATIDPSIARRKRIDRVPGRHWIDRLADRRPDLYGPLTER